MLLNLEDVSSYEIKAGLVIFGIAILMGLCCCCYPLINPDKKVEQEDNTGDGDGDGEDRGDRGAAARIELLRRERDALETRVRHVEKRMEQMADGAVTGATAPPPESSAPPPSPPPSYSQVQFELHGEKKNDSLV